MKKQLLCLTMLICMFICTGNMIAYAKANTMENGSVYYTYIKDKDELRKFIDSDGAYSVKDVIETNWSGYTNTYKLVFDEPGQLVVCPISDVGEVRFQLFSDFQLTSLIGKTDDLTGNRDTDHYGSIRVEEGTYYFRGERWNDTGVTTWTVFLGFIPDSGVLSNMELTEESLQYEQVNVQKIEKAYELGEYIDNDGIPSSTDRIETNWSGQTPVYSFEIEETGTLIYTSLTDVGDIRLMLYSNSSLTNLISKTDSVVGSRDNYYALTIEPGTYYYYGNRWNNTGSASFDVYLGFIPENETDVVYGLGDYETQSDQITDKVLELDYVNSTDDFLSMIKEERIEAQIDVIETNWSGFTKVYEINVPENGILFYSPWASAAEAKGYIYSDTHFRSRIFKCSIEKNRPENPYMIFLDEGTYYYYASRWNGTSPLTISNYFAFLPSSYIVDVTDIESKGDIVTLTVSYPNEDYNPVILDGTARIMQGKITGKYVDNSDFWVEENMLNAFDTNTIDVNKPGWYTIRVSKNGYPSVMKTVFVDPEMFAGYSVVENEVTSETESKTETETETKTDELLPSMTLEEENALLKEILEENGIDISQLEG